MAKTKPFFHRTTGRGAKNSVSRTSEETSRKKTVRTKKCHLGHFPCQKHSRTCRKKGRRIQKMRQNSKLFDEIFLLVLMIFCALKPCHSLPFFQGQMSYLRVMTFNLWNSGRNVDNGLEKIAKHIAEINPDIVALQEVLDAQDMYELTRRLGANWTFAVRHEVDADTGILTRHRIVDVPPYPPMSPDYVRVKVEVRLSENSVMHANVWSLHLDWHDYGPYAACNRMVTEPWQIEIGERFLGGSLPGRVPSVRTMVDSNQFRRDLQAAEEENELLLVAGDFNTPSHLDWVESTKHDHCYWTYGWPVSALLHATGLQDAFRLVFPDPLESPAHTWSPVQKYQDGWGGNTIAEPQDRIDVVYYRGSRWVPVNAFVYAGSEPIILKPNHWNNDWPSDHGSVVVDFRFA